MNTTVQVFSEDEPSKQEPPSSNVMVIAHGRCTDGFCAAWVARKVFPHAKFYFAQFGEAPPDVTNKEVFMLDFSYRRNILLQMRATAKSLTVLDHHKSAMADLDGLPFCIFDMEKSGAGLAWDYFSHFPCPGNQTFDEPRPWLIHYVEDGDLWRHTLNESWAVNAVVSSYPFCFERWDQLASKPLEEVIEEGKPIRRYQEQVANDLASYAREVNFDGYKVLSVNTSIMNSDVGNKIAMGRPFGVVWFQRDDGKYIYSLRSCGPEAIDVAKVAGVHGGGGHKLSSGFISDKILF